MNLFLILSLLSIYLNCTLVLAGGIALVEEGREAGLGAELSEWVDGVHGGALVAVGGGGEAGLDAGGEEEVIGEMGCCTGL